MTNQQGAPEALRLADLFELERDPESLYRLAAAELRRLHFENERLAALAEAQQPAPSAASKAVLAAIRAANMQLVRTGDDEFMLVTYKQATPQADSQPAPVLGTIAHVGTGKTTLTGAITSALRAASTEADNVTAPAGATSNAHCNQAPCAHCGCPEGQHFITRCHHIQGETRYTPTQQADSQPAKVWDYPPMPDFDTVEQHIYGACRSYITQDMLEPIHNLIRDVIDADRAARAPSSPAAKQSG